MATGLKSILQNPRLLLLFKTGLFVLFLILIKTGGFGWLPVLLFIGASSILFFLPVFQTVSYLTSFFVLVFAGLIFVAGLPAVYSGIGIVFLSGCFYLLLGIKNVVLVNRFRAYFIFNLAIFYIIFILFFLEVQNLLFLKVLALFFFSLLIFRDLLKFNSFPDVSWRKISAAAWVLALLVAEISWVISLLPFGFFQSANLTLVFVFVFSNLAIKYFSGFLGRKEVMTDVTVGVLLTMLVFITSSWII